GHGTSIVGWATTYMSNSHAHAITGQSVQIQTQQHIAHIADVVGKPDDKHRDAGKSRHLSREFNTQRIEFATGVLHVGGKGVCAFTRQQLEVHCEYADACSGISAERNSSGQRKRLAFKDW